MARLLAALALVLTVLFARTAIAGEASAAASLLFDARRLVEAQERAGWKIDRYAYEAMMPDALMSVCRTTDETRRLAVAEARRERERARVNDIDEVLFTERVTHLLEEAVRRAPTECPSWIEPQPDFASLQAGVNRFVLGIEASGSGMIQHAPMHPDGTTGFRGARGGGGRVLLGRGLGQHFSVRVGPELNVHMLVQRQSNPAELPVQIQAALPIVVRYTEITWHYNVELAPLLMLTDTNLVPRWGGRVGALIGIARLRERRVIPWAGLAAMVEVFPGTNGESMLVNLKGGLRAGLDWDFRTTLPRSGPRRARRLRD